MPEHRARAAGVVRDGVTVSCAHPVNTVADLDNASPVSHFMVRAGDVVDEDGSANPKGRR